MTSAPGLGAAMDLVHRRRTFAVSVFVIVWTTTGAPPPIGTPPTLICRSEAMPTVYERVTRSQVAPMTAPEPVNVCDYERLAEAALPAGPLGYYAGGAGDERTLRENVAAWSRRRLRPRVLVDVSAVSTATTVLGREIAAPVLVAPTALQRMAHPDGEPGMARAAAAAGTIMTLSTLCTSTPEEVAAAAPGAARWLQLYVTRDRGVSRALVDQAVDARVRGDRRDRRRPRPRSARARPPHAASASPPTSTCRP